MTLIEFSLKNPVFPIILGMGIFVFLGGTYDFWIEGLRYVKASFSSKIRYNGIMRKGKKRTQPRKKPTIESSKKFLGKWSPQEKFNYIMAFLTLVVSVCTFVFPYQNQLSQEKMQKKQNEMNNSILQRQDDFERGREGLTLFPQIPNRNNTKTKYQGEMNFLTDKGETGFYGQPQKYPYFSFHRQIGWVSRIYAFDATFKNSSHPIIEMKGQIVTLDEMGSEKNEDNFVRESMDGNFKYLQEGKTSYVFCNQERVFYPEIGSYQFFLIQGSGSKNYLIMDGWLKKEKVGFSIDNVQFALNTSKIPPKFKKEYQSTKKYLEDNGIKVN